MSASRGEAAPTASRWLPVLVWAAFILVLTSWPNPRVPMSASSIDKFAHFGLYGVLGFLVGRTIRPPQLGPSIVKALLVLAAFGAADEWHQRFISGRSMSVWDWVADIAGAFTGLLLAQLLLSLARARRDRPS